MINTDNNMDIDKLRSAWQECEVAEPKGVADSGVKSMQPHRSRLMRQHLVLAGVCGFWAVISIPLLCINPMVGFPMMAGLYMSIYFAMMGVLAVLEYYAYKDIDVYNMPVRSCMAAVLSAKRLRRHCKIAGMAMALPLLGYMIWFFHGVSTEMFAGALIGTVAGAFIGVLMDIRIRRHLREMTRYLESLDA